MPEKDRQVAESVFDKKQRRDAEIDAVLKEESARHDSAMKNLQRLRALRLEHEAKNPTVEKGQKKRA